MKKKIAILLTTVAIIVLGGFIYYSFLNEDNQDNDSIMINKDGEVVDPISEDSDNMGHE
ncbi:hypothetical protein [Kurthia sp. Dielmo]|uniref:hypothetical protein n=1 Tax=Kurthia sp. Dielmo TaxID=1033738 RepID=UPI001648B468|nr:hypothetical protein [Kurthia sp. Dielmo]